jgi:sugar phosphate permease
MLHMAGVSGLRGWQWLFLIEGAPAAGLAVAAYFYLPNRPSEARFLTAEEKAALARDLSEDEGRAGAEKGGFLAALRNARVYVLGLVYFAFYSTQSILLLWVPTLLKNTGVKDLTEIGWRASAVFVVGAIGMTLVGWSSDRAQERRWHMIGCGTIASTALSSLPLAAHDANATMLLLMTASAGIFSYLALFWTVPTAVLGSSARAGGIAVVSSIGASGSALSPTFIGWMQVLTGSLYGAITALALMFLASLVALWLCFPSPTVERRGHRQALARPAA